MTLDMDTMKEIHVREAGAWTEIGEVHILIDGAWVKVWDTAVSLAVSLSPTAAAFGAGVSSASIPVTTAEVTAVATGGTPPYTYAWNRDDTGSPSWSIDSPSSATTSFTCSTVGPAVYRSAEFECVVTDSLGATITSALVYATVENYGVGV